MEKKPKFKRGDWVETTDEGKYKASIREVCWHKNDYWYCLQFEHGTAVRFESELKEVK